MTRLLLAAFVVTLLGPVRARADDAGTTGLVPALTSPVGEQVDLFPRLALGNSFSVQDDGGAHPNAFTFGLLCPGGGQFMNGDWFAGMGVAATAAIFVGGGVTWVALDNDPSTRFAIGFTSVGIGLLIWLAAAVEASMGGACLGNCLGACITACGVASILPDGGSSRRRVINSGGGGRRGGSGPSGPAPQRPTPYAPSNPTPVPPK